MDWYLGQLLQLHVLRHSNEANTSQLWAHLATVSFGDERRGEVKLMGCVLSSYLVMPFQEHWRYRHVCIFDSKWLTSANKSLNNNLEETLAICSGQSVVSLQPRSKINTVSATAGCSEVEEFDIFLSHTWHTRGIWKFLSLSLQLSCVHILLCRVAAKWSGRYSCNGAMGIQHAILINSTFFCSHHLSITSSTIDASWCIMYISKHALTSEQSICCVVMRRGNLQLRWSWGLDFLWISFLYGCAASTW